MDDENSFTTFLTGVVVQAETKPNSWRRKTARTLLLQSASYAEHARAALIGELGMMPHARYHWEIELGLSADHYADRARRLAHVAASVIKQITPEEEK